MFDSINRVHRSLVLVLRVVVCAASLGCAGQTSSSPANIWTRTFNIEVEEKEIAPGRNAREIALRRAQELAAAEFGVAVLNEEKLDGERLTKRTRMVRAGVARSAIKSERPMDNSGGAGAAAFVIEVAIDSDEVDRQLSALRTDASRDQRLLTAVRELEVLQARLAATPRTLSPAGTVLERVLRDSSNTAADAIVFPRGALLEHARQNDPRIAQWDALERGFFDQARTKIVSVAVSRVDPIGGAVRATLNIGWSVDLDATRQAMRDIGVVYQQPLASLHADGVCINPSLSLRSIAADLRNEASWIEISIGQFKANFLLVGTVSSYWCIANAYPRQRTIEVIVPNEMAGSAGEIRTRVVRGKAGAEFEWKSMRMDLMQSTIFR